MFAEDINLLDTEPDIDEEDIDIEDEDIEEAQKKGLEEWLKESTKPEDYLYEALYTTAVAIGSVAVYTVIEKATDHIKTYTVREGMRMLAGFATIFAGTYVKHRLRNGAGRVLGNMLAGGGTLAIIVSSIRLSKLFKETS